MFKHKKKSASSKNDNSTISSVNMVSEGTEIIGTLITKSDTRVAGKVEGEAKVAGKIIVASTGHVDGNIKSEDADIAGRVEGEIHVTGKLMLRQSAVVQGDLHAQCLIVEEGATFNGTCHMRDYDAENIGNKNKDDSKPSAIKDKDSIAV